MKDQAHKLRELVKGKNNSQPKQKQKKQSDIARTYTVTSGKGGVGKTNFTVNLALALQSEDKNIAIIDADLGMANIDVILGLTPQYNLGHVISGKREIMEIVAEGPGGLNIIPGVSGIESLANLSEYQLQNLIAGWEVLENEFDIILIDTGAGISKKVVNFILAADEAIVLCTPEPTAITDAYGVIKVISNNQKDAKINLVINQIESSKEGNRVSKRIIEVAKEFLDIELDILGSIPKDKSVTQAVKKQNPFLLEFPDCEASIAIKDIRNKILDIQIEEKEKTKGIKGFFKSLVNLSR
ncbi:MinD/ParA family protein [Fuchsiella alkaliacetigena]|uniref:MinD/ParA family protein n=1 Tax=Fuchsiella alkaliacetigena TaxID=957042 RepID=UPI00200A5798|nr:MinD/ParA family protein [Fuchsiella alkaliacetigena]MCK8823531.1 MinD/ParA family protein [Fuchsiella alkaliacetigena]